jgi:hypothetical protein
MRSASEKAAAVSALRNDVKQMEQRAGAKKDFETKQSSVFATPGSPLAHFLTAESGFKASYDLFGFSAFHQSCYLAAVKGRQSILPSDLDRIAFFSRREDRSSTLPTIPSTKR